MWYLFLTCVLHEQTMSSVIVLIERTIAAKNNKQRNILWSFQLHLMWGSSLIMVTDQTSTADNGQQIQGVTPL